MTTPRSHGDQPNDPKIHINRDMTKLHARDRAQLAVIAYQSGLVTRRDI